MKQQGSLIFLGFSNEIFLTGSEISVKKSFSKAKITFC